MKPSERDKLKTRYGSRGVEIKAAIDGLSVYVHESNPIKKSPLNNLKQIYTGEITNWKESGARSAHHPVCRENSSGTYVYSRTMFWREKITPPRCRVYRGRPQW